VRANSISAPYQNILVNYSQSCAGFQLIFVTFLSWSTIISGVKYISRLWIFLRVLISLGLITLLGVSSGWRAFDREIYKASKALESNDSWGASLAFAQAAELSPSRNDLWEQAGIYALQAGEHQIAQSFLERVESRSELSSPGLVAMGDIAHHKGEDQIAIGYWEKALSTDDNYELHFRLADSYYQLGDLEKAVQHQTSLVELDPMDSSTNLQLGMMLTALEPESSLAYLSHALDLDPHAFVSAAQSLASIEEWTLAEFALSKATQLNPEYAEAWAYLGEARQHVGKDGFADLEKALLIEPDSIAVNTLMALYWQRQERHDLALVYLHSAAIVDHNNPALQAEIGNTLGLLGNITSAESHYIRAVDLAPKDPTYWRILANFYIRYETKLREEGLAAARQAVILDQNDPASLDAMAQIYLLMESPHIARRFLDRSLAADHAFAPAHLHLGLVHIMNGDTLQAFQQFSLAKEFSKPGSPTANLADRLLETHFP
jgi:tetratricopeptide (TPR) repeat protein